MDGKKTVTAVFIASEYTLTINVEGGGTASRNYTGPYYYGSVVQLTAIPDQNWTFSEWSGHLTGTENPATIIMTELLTEWIASNVLLVAAAVQFMAVITFVIVRERRKNRNMQT